MTAHWRFPIGYGAVELSDENKALLIGVLAGSVVSKLKAKLDERGKGKWGGAAGGAVHRPKVPRRREDAARGKGKPQRLRE